MSSSWDPYVLSQRLVNWIYFLEVFDSNDQEIINSTYQQALYLYDNIEFHLLGNHILSNYRALYVCGVFFQNEDLRRIGRHGFEFELSRQFLKDGAHFELSPLYQYKLIVELLEVYWRAVDESDFRNSVASYINGALVWIRYLCFPDGRLSCFNDSAAEIVGTLAELESLVQSYGLDVPDFDYSSEKAAEIASESGYCVLQRGDWKVIFDHGLVRAKYISGHSHDDALSIEVSRSVYRVFTNAGISTYAVGQRRTLERSSLMHNTISCGGKCSIDCWSSFRVGKINQPRDRSFVASGSAIKASSKVKFVAGGGYVSRSVQLFDDYFLVVDRFDRSVDLSAVVVKWHLYPDVVINNLNTQQFDLNLPDKTYIRCHIFGGKCEKGSYEYAHGFDKRRLADVIDVIPNQNEVLLVIEFEK